MPPVVSQSYQSNYPIRTPSPNPARGRRLRQNGGETRMKKVGSQPSTCHGGGRQVTCRVLPSQHLGAALHDDYCHQDTTVDRGLASSLPLLHFLTSTVTLSPYRFSLSLSFHYIHPSVRYELSHSPPAGLRTSAAPPITHHHHRHRPPPFRSSSDIP